MSAAKRLVFTSLPWMFLWGLGSVAPVWAEQVNITAEYHSGNDFGTVGAFKNTTRASSVCADAGERFCNAIKVFSVGSGVVLRSNSEIRADHAAERQGVMFKAPASWKTIEIRNTITGESHALQFRIAGIAFKGETEDVRSLTGTPMGSDPSGKVSHNKLWNSGSFRKASSPCVSFDPGDPGSGPEYFRFVWMTPVDGVCAKQAKFRIPRIDFNDMEVLYQWETPKAWVMGSGQYVGELTYTLGAGGDFDVGDVLAPSEDTLTLRFTLDVDHTLNVHLSPGGNRVELVPEGGWQRWLQNPAHVPKKLFRDQDFHLTASGRFGMRLICSTTYGEWCAIRNENNHSIPVAVDVSLPSGIVDSEGRPVVRQAIRNDQGVKFRLSNYVDNKPGTLHFETNRLVDEMLRDHAGSTYSGTITVVWDSDV